MSDILPAGVLQLATLSPPDRVGPLAAYFQEQWNLRMNGLARATIGLIAERQWDPADPSDPMQTCGLALMENGALPLLLYLGAGEPEGQMARIDGLLLPGGYDIDPHLYAESRFGGSRLTEVDYDFDRFELRCARIALEAGMPILGICRGAQMLNVAAGGNLWQDLDRAADHQQSTAPQEPAHSVRVAPESSVGAALEGRLQVNSKHHQAVEDLAPGFRVTARAPDGNIEAFERVGGCWQVGCEFHPELQRESQPKLNELFRRLVREGERRRR